MMKSKYRKKSPVAQWSPILAVLALLVLGTLCWRMMSSSSKPGEPAEAVNSNNRKTKVTARSAAEVNPKDPQSHGDSVTLYVLLKFNEDFKDCQSFTRGSSHDPIKALIDGAEQSNCIMIEQGLLITAEGPKEEVKTSSVPLHTHDASAILNTPPSHHADFDSCEWRFCAHR